MPRTRLAFTLWPDESEEAALANLRRHLALLETTLPADRGPWIAKNRATGAWVGGERASVDVIDFERLAADPQRYREATALYRGDFLETEDDEWIVAHRQLLKDRQCAMLRNLIGRYRAHGNREEAYACALQAYRLDPWDEEMLRAVMSMRHERGDRVGALDVFREFEERVKRELGAEPLPASIRVFEEVRSASPRAALASVSTLWPRKENERARRDNLPARITRFFGREAELASLESALESERLVTLWGPGGVGKTSLAREAGERLARRFGGRVRFVDLADVNDRDGVAARVSQRIGMFEVPGRPITDVLIEALRNEHVLVILDNCEHVLDVCARLCDRILRECADVTVLTTSREALDMQGEFVFAVSPLPVPVLSLTSSIQSLCESAVVGLFLDRARLELPAGFAGRSLLEEILRIAQLLDGLPLAIELAASAARSAPVSEISESLARPLEVLRAGNRGALPRQQTLEATIAWTYDRMAEVERSAFARLAVFDGPFDATMAAEICYDDAEQQTIDSDALGKLASCCLLTETIVPDGRRYRFFDTIHKFARRRFDELPARAGIRRRHADHFVARALAVPELFWSERSISWLARLEDDVADLRGAIRALLDDYDDVSSAAAALVALQPFWLDSGRAEEARTWYERVLKTGGERLAASDRCELLIAATFAASRLGHSEQAQSYLRDAAACCPRGGDVEGRLLRASGTLDFKRGRIAAGSAALRESASLLRGAAEPHQEALSLAILGNGLVAAGVDAGESREILERSLALGRKYGYPMIVGRSLMDLSELARANGDVTAAYVLARASLEAFERGEGRGRSFMSESKVVLARLELRHGELERCRELLLDALSFYLAARQAEGAVRALLVYAELALACGENVAATLVLGATAVYAEARVAVTATPGDRHDVEARARARSGAGAYAREFARGRGMSLDEVLTNAPIVVPR